MTTNAELRISSLPIDLKDDALTLVKALDANGDGAIDAEEFVAAVKSLKGERSSNRNLTRLVSLLSVASLLLIAAIFGVSIAAAHLSNDTKTDSNGDLLDKATGNVVATTEATEWLDSDTTVVNMTDHQLTNINKIVLLEGAAQIDVRGYAKNPSGDQVMIVTEGGSITFDKDGVVDATGIVDVMLSFASDTNETDGRRLKFQKYLIRSSKGKGHTTKFS